MTEMQMMVAVSSSEAIAAIGRDMAESIFFCIVNRERADAHMLIAVANLASVIGYDEAEAIFNELMSR